MRRPSVRASPDARANTCVDGLVGQKRERGTHLVFLSFLPFGVFFRLHHTSQRSLGLARTVTRRRVALLEPLLRLPRRATLLVDGVGVVGRGVVRLPVRRQHIAQLGALQALEPL